jgi:hypothetical protein
MKPTLPQTTEDLIKQHAETYATPIAKEYFFDKGYRQGYEDAKKGKKLSTVVEYVKK